MTNSDETDTPTTDNGRFRRVVGPDGRHWTVHEFASSRYDRRAGMSLVFVTDDAMRRVRDFPPNWFELGDDELYAVSLSR